MSQSTQEMARIGEVLPAEHLEERGYQIFKYNYRSRPGEIDFIAPQGKRVVFVEVKTRRSLKFGVPQAAVTPTKQKQIAKLAVSYLQTHNLLDAPGRFDVVAIVLSSKFTLLKLNHIENAFEFVAEE